MKGDEIIDLARPLIIDAIKNSKPIPAETLKLIEVLGNWHLVWAIILFTLASVCLSILWVCVWREDGEEGTLVLSIIFGVVGLALIVAGAINFGVWLEPLGAILTTNWEAR